jgi:hypothetical protein
MIDTPEEKASPPSGASEKKKKKLTRRETLKLAAVAGMGALAAVAGIDEILKETGDESKALAASGEARMLPPDGAGKGKTDEKLKTVRGEGEAPAASGEAETSPSSDTSKKKKGKEETERKAPEEVMEIPPSEEISGLETYGHNAPLSQEQTDTLIDHLNDEYSRGITERVPGTIYATELVRPEEYRLIPGLTEDPDYQTFLNRHEEVASTMLSDADPLLSGGLKNRRCIGVEEGVVVCASWHRGWVTDGIFDCHGASGLWFNPRPYRPPDSAYWDSEARIDRGKIHEDGHLTFGIPDTYVISGYFGVSGARMHTEVVQLLLHEAEFYQDNVRGFTPDKIREIEKNLQEERVEMADLPPALEGIPTEWHNYYRGNRNDEEGRSLMTSCDLNLSGYETWLLARRVAQGWSENDYRIKPEGVADFPQEVAVKNTFVFGEDYEGAQVQVWRTNGDYANLHLNDPAIFEGTVENGEVEVGNPFSTESGINLTPEGLVPGYQALLFVRVTKDLGGGEVEEFCRYVDMGDISKGLGYSHYPYQLKMHMELADKNTSQAEFNWAIVYEKLRAPHEIHLPLVEKN